MKWIVEIGKEFEPEFDALLDDVRTEILAHARLLQQFGPQLGRPRVDTLDNSRHPNLKEFKSGGSQNGFYRDLIRKADNRFDEHLSRLKQEKTR